ncbi:MAG: hypothetical protein U5N53_14250 [Mycobacterium sp.]|nr:hypothetical protein [Mycobacterium sp.]
MRSQEFAFHLRSRFAELGRDSANHESFWRGALQHMPLARAMAVLDRELSVP